MANGKIAEMVEKQWNKYIEDLTKNAKKLYKEVKAKYWSDWWEWYEKKMREMFRITINTFYMNYRPVAGGYDRNRSLYELLEIRLTEDGNGIFNGMDIWFEPKNMTAFRNGYDGENGLYDQVFRKGWHGGAASASTGLPHPNPGKPYWREPIPYYTKWGTEAEVEETPPLEDFKLKKKDYEESGMQTDFDRIKKERMKKDFYNVISGW